MENIREINRGKIWNPIRKQIDENYGKIGKQILKQKRKNTKNK